MDRTTASGYVLNADNRRVYADYTPGETDGTILVAADRTAIQEEIVGCIEGASLEPDASNLGQLWAAIKAAAAAAAKSVALAFVPVEQGGGPNQGSAKINIGIATDNAHLRAASGGTDLGMLALTTDVAGETDRASASEAAINQSLQSSYTTMAAAMTPYMRTSGGTLIAPDWATRVMLRLIGPGGAGATATDTTSAGNYSGGGGGAGGEAWGIYTISAGDSLVVVIGSGGVPGTPGTASTVTLQGTTLCTANSGGNASFPTTQAAPGAAGGTASGGTLINNQGGSGTDGQNGTNVFAGNGAESLLGGGAGRAGATAGLPASKPGAGGGGGYGANNGSTSPGGNGASGALIYQWLP